MAELATIPSEGIIAAAMPRQGPRPRFARFRRHRLALFGVVTILVLVLGSAVGPYLIPFDELFIDIRHRFAPPFISAHVLGTDPLGRDLLAACSRPAGSRLPWASPPCCSAPSAP